MDTTLRHGEVSTRREELEPALAELSARERKVLSLRYLAGLDETDVSEALGISVKAVRRYAAQGTAALRSREVIRNAQPPSHKGMNRRMALGRGSGRSPLVPKNTAASLPTYQAPVDGR